MTWTALPFGKYRGKTLPQIVFADPDWFFWAYEESVFRGPLAAEAERVYRRARRIKVPQRDGADRVVEYRLTRDYAKFAEMEVVEVDRLLQRGSPTMGKPWIDLGYPRSVCRYDKAGMVTQGRRASSRWLICFRKITHDTPISSTALRKKSLAAFLRFFSAR